MSDSTETWSIDDAGACADCIAFAKLVVLGDTTPAGAVGEPMGGTLDKSGRYWIGQRGHVKIYGQDGALLKSLGRQGRGPGEFSIPKPIHTDASGNVYIIDPGNGRASLYAPDLSMRAETSIPFRDAFSIAPLEDGASYLVNTWLQSELSAGLTLHIIRQDSVIRSFGPPSDQEPMTRFRSERVVTTDEDGRAFSTERFRFRISVFSPEGRPISRIAGPELNIAAPTGPRINLLNNPLPSEILGMRLLDEHLLLVLSRRVRKNWRIFFVGELLSDGVLGMRTKPGQVISPESLFSTRLEVVDLRSRRIVARQDRDEVFAAFIGNDLLMHYTEDENGEPTIAVWRVSLHVP